MTLGPKLFTESRPLFYSSYDRWGDKRGLGNTPGTQERGLLENWLYGKMAM